MRLNLSRRQLMAAAAFTPFAVQAQGSVQKLRFGIATKVISPIVINCVIPEILGYYREEGISIETIPLGSNAAVMGSVQSGRIEFGVGVPSFQIPLVGKGDALPARNFYEYTYPFKWGVAVMPGSPIKSLAELKGKRVGVSSVGQSDYPVGQSVFRVMGMDPDKDVSWLSVGEGVTAGEALRRGAIDGLFYYDTGFGTIEAAGIEMRYLPMPSNVPKVGGLYLSATEATLATHRKWAVGFGRGVAKASVFTLENPTAAAVAFIQMYPEAAPKGMSMAEQIKAIQNPIEKRAKLFTSYDKADPRWGHVTPNEWNEEIEFAGLKGKAGDPGSYFTNDLIAEINDFSADKIREQARNYRMPA